ncbi:MAG: substrate-binding and VWA domain-containing protein [Verrucomicrobiota bacterium]
MKQRWNAFIGCLVLGSLLSGCGGPSAPPGSSGGVTLSIVSGSENKGLEPIIKQFAAKKKVHIEMHYQGSVDISREIARGTQSDFDAFWPAASLWIALGDTQNLIKHKKSIMRSPVVFALKRKEVERLGWIGKEVTVKEILEAVLNEHVRFAMTSATQSNSGAAWYLGCLTAFAGRPEVMTSDHLKEDDVRTQIKQFLGAVDRSVGSSGWLKTMFLEYYNRFEGMVNYEALVIEANQELVSQNKEPLYVIYPVDGLSIADSPLGYMSRGELKKEKLFQELQAHLLSPDVQKKIENLGRRTGVVGMNSDAADTRVFNPDWGIDLKRILSPIRTPAGPVVQEALTLYQTAFRKPSLTAFVLDYSGSMRGVGEKQLKEAMFTLLDPDEAAQFLLQPSPEDKTFVLPFSSDTMATWSVEGNELKDLRGLLRQVEQQSVGGGTQMYAATIEALKLLKPLDESGEYHTAVILMSDGKSEGSLREFQGLNARHQLGRDIPIYTILFGQAEKAQMEPLAEWSSGKMFDGRKNVVKAFRKAKGYN